MRKRSVNGVNDTHWQRCLWHSLLNIRLLTNNETENSKGSCCLEWKSIKIGKYCIICPGGQKKKKKKKNIYVPVPERQQIIQHYIYNISCGNSQNMGVKDFKDYFSLRVSGVIDPADTKINDFKVLTPCIRGPAVLFDEKKRCFNWKTTLIGPTHTISTS
jgi:hypothetical protein